jgi:Kinesin motor domain
MLGPGTKLKDMTEDEKGCMPRAMTQIFEALETSDKYTTWKMQLSYIEVYLDKIYDLLRTPGTTAIVEGDVTVMKDGVARLKHITPTAVETLQVGAVPSSCGGIKTATLCLCTTAKVLYSLSCLGCRT